MCKPCVSDLIWLLTICTMDTGSDCPHQIPIPLSCDSLKKSLPRPFSIESLIGKPYESTKPIPVGSPLNPVTRDTRPLDWTELKDDPKSEPLQAGYFEILRNFNRESKSVNFETSPSSRLKETKDKDFMCRKDFTKSTFPDSNRTFSHFLHMPFPLFYNTWLPLSPSLPLQYCDQIMAQSVPPPTYSHQDQDENVLSAEESDSSRMEDGQSPCDDAPGSPTRGKYFM